METKLTTKKMGIIVILIMSFISFIVSIATVYAENMPRNNKVDIRFVIDMSAAAQKEDPHKYRVRALQKIIKSLPDNAVSGIWTYGKYVNMLMPIGDTYEMWKKQAIYKMDAIKGYGNYRNLGDAIDKASYGWQSKNNYRKYIVILTNGDLRVSAIKQKNAVSQLKLLTKTLPKLKKANIELHTVSMSTKADTRLLKVLASQTNGNWYHISHIEALPQVINHVYQVIAKKSGTNINTRNNTVYARAKPVAGKQVSNKLREFIKNNKDIKDIKQVRGYRTAKNSTRSPKASNRNAIKYNARGKGRNNTNTGNIKHQQFKTKYKTKYESNKSNTRVQPVKHREKRQPLKNEQGNSKYNNRKSMDFNWPAA